MRAPGYISAVGKGRVHKARSSRQFPVGIFAKKLYIGKGKKEVRIWESSLKLKDMSLNPAAGGHICQPLVGERLNANPAPKCGGEEVFSNPLMEQTP